MTDLHFRQITLMAVWIMNWNGGREAERPVEREAEK